MCTGKQILLLLFCIIIIISFITYTVIIVIIIGFFIYLFPREKYQVVIAQRWQLKPALLILFPPHNIHFKWPNKSYIMSIPASFPVPVAHDITLHEKKCWKSTV